MGGKLLTQERLKELLEYDPDSGHFYRRKTGELAGWKKDGYICMSVDNRKYRAARLAFLYMKGKWPTHFMDHINRVRDDNRWINLREVTPSENSQNMSMHKDNIHGLQGVHWKKSKRRKDGGRWCAQLCKNGKRTLVGYFPTAEEAHEAYLEAKGG